MKLSKELDVVEDSPQPIVSFARDLKQGDSFPFHRHQRAQLVYASSGVMNVSTKSTSYVVPPQRAVLMPAQVEHRIDTLRAVSMRSLYIKPYLIKAFPTKPCVIQITPLLKELIVTAVALGNDYQITSPQCRIMQVIIDQITVQPIISLALPLPSDPRLARITHKLIENPADSRTLDQWANFAGASKRTLNRLFSKETGMSFQSWRQQLRLHRGLELLAVGSSVTQVALELGYENTSAFIAMFKRCTGTTPMNYLQIQRTS